MMRSLYEHKWQKAVKGAKIEPSEALWDKIASNLDKERGRNYWVTLLMIAATVTIAFSFPLTIGDSSFEARPDRQQYIGQVENNDPSNLSQPSSLSSIDSKSGNNHLPNSETKNTDLASSHKYQVNTINSFIAGSKTKDSNSLSSENSTANYKIATVQSTEFSSLHWGNTYKLADINSYYFIPYYMPVKKDDKRNLLASLNMGTGNSSNGNGLLNNSKVESAGALSFSDGYNALSNSNVRNESNGTTFYIGTGLELPIGKRWSLLAGIGYLAQKAEGTNNVVSDNGNGYKPLGVHDPLELGSVFLSESYQYSRTNNYISIPISFKYPIINRKIKFRAGAGISTDFMLSHIINSETYGRVSYNPSQVAYESVVISGLINFDASYSLSNLYSIALETGFRKGITPIDKSKEFYPSSFTVGIVLFYKIR